MSKRAAFLGGHAHWVSEGTETMCGCAYRYMYPSTLTSNISRQPPFCVLLLCSSTLLPMELDFYKLYHLMNNSCIDFHRILNYEW